MSKIVGTLRGDLLGLEHAGVVARDEVRAFDRVALSGAEEMDAQAIKHLRRALRLSRKGLAQYLRTTVSMVGQWEGGKTLPSEGALVALRYLAARGVALLGNDGWIVSDPDIRGGEPIVRGTRVPVSRLRDLHKQGVPDSVLLSEHPSLTPESLEVALLYAKLYPHPEASKEAHRSSPALVRLRQRRCARVGLG